MPYILLLLLLHVVLGHAAWHNSEEGPYLQPADLMEWEAEPAWQGLPDFSSTPDWEAMLDWDLMDGEVCSHSSPTVWDW